MIGQRRPPWCCCRCTRRLEVTVVASIKNIRPSRIRSQLGPQLGFLVVAFALTSTPGCSDRPTHIIQGGDDGSAGAQGGAGSGGSGSAGSGGGGGVGTGGTTPTDGSVGFPRTSRTP